MLAMEESAYHNSKHSATKISPLYANYGFEQRTNWPTEVQFKNPASDLYGPYMTSVNLKLKKQLEQSIEMMRHIMTQSGNGLNLIREENSKC